VYVPCKRKPYMTQLSEPKRLCNYESFSPSVFVSSFLCVHWGWNLQRSEKVATLAEDVFVVVSAGHADCRHRQEKERETERGTETERETESAMQSEFQESFYEYTHTLTQKCIKPNR